MANEKPEITCQVLLPLDETLERNGVARLQVVKWNNNTPKLEKRSFYFDKVTGDEKTGKAMGFTITDLETIKSRYDEIVNAMKETKGGEVK